MSSNWSEEKEYHCSNDCTQLGCPGHKMKIEYNRGSDIIIIWEDDEPEHYFDYNSFNALLVLAKDKTQ